MVEVVNNTPQIFLEGEPMIVSADIVEYKISLVVRREIMDKRKLRKKPKGIQGIDLQAIYSPSELELQALDAPKWISLTTTEERRRGITFGGEKLPFAIEFGESVGIENLNVTPYSGKMDINNIDGVHIEEIPFSDQIKIDPRLDFKARFILKKPPLKTENYPVFEAIYKKRRTQLTFEDVRKGELKSTIKKETDVIPPRGIINVKANGITLALDPREEIKHNFMNGEIDHKLAYSDPNGAKRWDDMCYFEHYEIFRVSKEFLRKKTNDICAMIIQSEAECFDLLDLGVGNGEKSCAILEGLTKYRRDEKIKFFALDIHPSLTNMAQRVLIRYGLDEKVDFKPCIADIQYLNYYQLHEDRPLLITFSGGSLGNFDEEKVLRAIHDFMQYGDYFLMGIEYVAGRDNETLKAIYTRNQVKSLVLYPLCYLDDLGMSAKEMNKLMDEVEPDVLAFPRISRIPGARSIVYKHSFKGVEIILYRSTKYEEKQLLDYLEQMGFSIIHNFMTDDGRYSEILTKRA